MQRFGAPLPPIHSSILSSHKHTHLHSIAWTFLFFQFSFVPYLFLNCGMSRFFQTINSETEFRKYLKNGNKIAKGAFGKVYEGVNRETGKVVAAVKRCELDIYQTSPSDSDLREVRRRLFFDFAKSH